MNFFKRFTSVFLSYVLLSSFFVVPVSAVDDSDYYSLSPVVGFEPSLSVSYPVNPSATGDGWTDFDRNLLQAIKNALTDISSGSINWYLTWIYDLLRGDIRSSLGNIDRNTSVTVSRIMDSNSLLGSINTAVSGINGYATEKTLSGFSSDFLDIFATGMSASLSPGYGTRFPFKNPDNSTVYVSFGQLLWYFQSYLAYDGFVDGQYTLYHFVKNLSETLASEDDKQLSQNQKENREQVEQDFLSGKSGKTSLGKEDFGNLSGVGGTFKDITSLNGQASIGSFTDGLSSANETGQGWFSQATKDALDSVSDSSSSVSTFSVDGDYMKDLDPYNMSGFEDHYAWLWGD